MNKILDALYKMTKRNKPLIMIVFIIILVIYLFTRKEYYSLNTPSLVTVTVSWPAITRSSYPNRKLTSDEKSKLKYKVELLTVLGETSTLIDFKEVIAITSVTFQEVSITDSETKIRVKVYARLDQDGSAYSTEGVTKDSEVIFDPVDPNDINITIEFPLIEGFTKHNDNYLGASDGSGNVGYGNGNLYTESRETMTIQQAKDKCNELANCGGFYYHVAQNLWKFRDGNLALGGNELKPSTKVPTSTAYLKDD